MASVALGVIDGRDGAAPSSSETESGVALDLELSLGRAHEKRAPEYLMSRELHLQGRLAPIETETEPQIQDHRFRIEGETSRAKPSSSSSSSVRARIRNISQRYDDRPWTDGRHRAGNPSRPRRMRSWGCVHGDDDDDDDDDAAAAAGPAIPLDVLERVLARLQTIPLFRVRTVCRAFRALPLDPAFQVMRSSCSTASQERPWLLMLNKSLGPLGFAFLPQEDKWISLPSSFEPDPGGGGGGQGSASSQGSRRFYVFCAAAAGLLCFCELARENETQVQSMWVGNPLTGNWKCLPPTARCLLSNSPATGLAEMVLTLDPADETRAHYKVVVRTWLHENCPVLEEYDSRTDEWTVTCTSRDLETRSHLQQLVHCNGTVYFLGEASMRMHCVFAFDLESKKLSRIRFPEALGGCCTGFHLVDCCGKLVLVASCGRTHSAMMDVRVWLHTWQNSTGFRPWRLLGKMPKRLLDEWVPCSQFYCTSISHLVYLTNTTNMVAFDVEKCNWRRIIIRDLPSSISICNFTSYMPKLEVSP